MPRQKLLPVSFSPSVLTSTHPGFKGKRRRMDLVIKLEDGTYLGIEVKSGNGKRNSFQRNFDNTAGNYTVQGIGSNTDIIIS